MNVKYKYLALGAVISAMLFGIWSYTMVDKNDVKVNIAEDGRLVYKWFPTKTPDKMHFAGESVPLKRWDVQERLDRELLINYYMHGSLLYNLKLSTRAFPFIEAKLKENNIPEDFKFLCVAESSLQNLTSPAGAVGFWQFLKATAIQYGLEVNDEVDERYHLEKSTEAACKYLKDAYVKFGNWTNAAASYNCGMGGLNSRITYQRQNSYYDLMLPEETNRYVFRILALKLLMENAEKYGYIIPEEDQYQDIPMKVITVTSSINDLADFAISQGSTYKVLKIINPWLRDKTLTVKSGKTYQIKLPQI